MSNPLPIMCGPDSHLTQSHLQELYDDYMSASHPRAATFASLVNNVRLPYMSALFAAKEALLVQQTEHAKQLAELQASHQCTATLKSGSPRDGGIAKEALASSAQTIVGDSEAEVSNGDGEDLALLEPQKGHELLHKSSVLIVNRFRDHDQDWVSWEGIVNNSNWKEHMQLNVFRSHQPGTVKVCVLQYKDRYRMYCTTDHEILGEPWKLAIEFWGYPDRRPRTTKVRITYLNESRGCIVEQEGAKTKVENWQSWFSIWLPV